MASKDINRRFTVDLEISTGDAEKKVKATVGNLKTILNDLSKSSDKMKFFQELVDYLSQVDAELDRFKQKHGDGLFNQIFGGLDTTIRQEMEKTFGATREQLAVLEQLRKRAADLQGKDLGDKDVKNELRSIEAEVKSLYKSIGRFDLADKIGTGQFNENRLNKLSDALNNFGTVFEGVRDKIAKGFQFGGSGAGSVSGISEELQKEIDRLEQQKKELQEILDSINNPGKVKIDIKSKDSIDELKKIIEQYKAVTKEINSDEFRSRTYYKPEEYNKKLAEQVRLATIISNTIKDIEKFGTSKQQDAIFGLDVDTNKLDEFLSNFRNNSQKEAEQIKSIFGNLIVDINAQLEKIHISSDKDKFLKKIQEYNEAFNDKEGFKQIEDIEKLFVSLAKTEEEAENVKNVLEQLGETNISVDEAFDQLIKILGLFQNEIPNATRSSEKAFKDFSKVAISNVQNAIEKIRQSIKELNDADFSLDAADRKYPERFVQMTSSGNFVTVDDIDGGVSTEKIVATMLSSISDKAVAALHSHPKSQAINGETYYENYFSGSLGDMKSVLNNMKLGYQATGMIAGDIVRILDTSKLSIEQMESVLKTLRTDEREIAKTDSHHFVTNDDGDIVGYQNISDAQQAKAISDTMAALISGAFEKNGIKYDDIYKKYDLSNIEQSQDLAKHLLTLASASDQAVDPVQNLQNIIQQFSHDDGRMQQALADFKNGLITAVEAFNRSVDPEKIQITQDDIDAVKSFNPSSKTTEDTATNTSQEASRMEELRKKVQDVRDAVDQKTRAFGEEKEALDGIVPREIEKLRELEEYLKQLQQIIQELFDNLKIPENIFEGLKSDLNEIESNVSSIVASIGEIDKFKSINGISSDAKVDGENLNISLQPILETLQAIQGILKGFTGVDADSKDSIKYKEPVKPISDAERDVKRKATQYIDLDDFIHQNVKALMAVGINSREATQNLWRDANYNREDFHPVEMAMEDVASVIRNKVPENILDGWFRNADSNYKSRLEHVALTDTNVRNAALNAMWDNYKNYSGKDIGFKEFLYSDIPVYRGKNNEKYVDGDELLSFTFDRSVAENFGNHVLEAMIRPIDTIGSYQTTGENEVLVRRDQLEQKAEYQTWLNNMSSGMKESFVQAVRQSNIDDSKVDENSYALETTLQTVKGVLDSILAAVKNIDVIEKPQADNVTNSIKPDGVEITQEPDSSNIQETAVSTGSMEQFADSAQRAEDSVTELGQAIQAVSDSTEALHGQSLSEVASGAQKAADNVSELGDELQRTSNIEQQSENVVSEAVEVKQEAQAHRENADAIKQEVAAQEKANNVQKTGFEIVKDYWRSQGMPTDSLIEGLARSEINRLLGTTFDTDPESRTLSFVDMSGGNPNDISKYTQRYQMFDQTLQQIGYHLGELQPVIMQDGKQFGFSAQVIANSERVVTNLEEARNILFGISNDNGIEQQVAAEQKLADAAKETADAKQKQVDVAKEDVQEKSGTKRRKKLTPEQVAYQAQANADISALRKGAKDSIKNIGFDLTGSNLTPEQQEIKNAFSNLLIQLENYLDRVRDGEQVEIDSARAVVNALKEKTDAYKEANKEADAAQSKAEKEAKAAERKTATRKQFVDQKVADETTRHDSLQKASTTTFADSSAVQSAFNTYHQSYQKLIDLQTKLKASDNITADDVSEFNAAKTACDNYAKSLEKIINSSNKMRDESEITSPIKHIMDGFDDSIESRRVALEKFVRDTYGANAAIGDFGKSCNSLNFTVKNSDGSFSQMTASINQARNAINAISKSTGDAKGDFTSFFDKIKSKSKELLTYTTSMIGVQEIFQQIRNGIQYVREIDSALTELKKVTNETDATYDAFLQKMSKTGAVVGATVSNLTNMAAEWARLGYSLEEAGMLAESTAILLNVSEFEDATTASEALISTMQAFGYAAQDSQHVVDVLNEVKVTCLLVQ